MIIIVDDTFIDRSKYNDICYLKEPKYTSICTIYSIIKTTDLFSLVKQLSNCPLFCHHKTLQLFNTKKEPLNIKDNTTNRDTLINKVSQLNIERIEFSRGLETNYKTNKIDKYLFYTNLKPFLDYFIETNTIEPKILFWGESFKEKEKMLIIQKMMMQVRRISLEQFKENLEIEEGLNILYPNQSNEKIIEEWISKQLSENEIILTINNQIQ